MASLPLKARAKLWLLNFPRKFNRWYHRGFGQHRFNPNGIDIKSEDWDNLIILDACRYDTFKEVSDLPGTTHQRESRGSTTQEFLKANFGNRDFRDTVYVTAAPAIHATEDVDPSFHAVLDLWSDSWDPDLRTVHPKDVTQTAIETHDQYPNKRLLVHYLQPHYPFIGPLGQKHFDNSAITDPHDQNREGVEAKFWQTVGTQINDVPEEIVREAYHENLELTLPHIHDFLEAIEGLTVVTADHGEMLNDRSYPIPYRTYGHPPGLYTPELVKIPWHTHINGKRREIIQGQEPDWEGVDTEVVKERLRDLGYEDSAQ